MTRITRCMAGAALALAATAFPGTTLAQDYPHKPIRVIVGPGFDLVARLLAQKFTESWGQQVVIDPRPGAGGTIAAELVARAMPDGYTLLLATSSHTINAVLQPGSYDLLKDFAAVAFAASSPYILIVHPSFPAQSVQELIALARAKPGQINYGSGGNGTGPHLTGEMFKTLTRVNLVHVPYKVATAAVLDVIAGQTQMAFTIMALGLPQVRAGKVRGIAVTGITRATAFPDIPTVAESGLPGFEVLAWNGYLAPARTPRAIVTKINAEIVRLLKDDETRQRIASSGWDPAAGNTPEQFARYMQAETTKWVRVVKEANLKVD